MNEITPPYAALFRVSAVLSFFSTIFIHSGKKGPLNVSKLTIFRIAHLKYLMHINEQYCDEYFYTVLLIQLE